MDVIGRIDIIGVDKSEAQEKEMDRKLKIYTGERSLRYWDINAYNQIVFNEKGYPYTMSTLTNEYNFDHMFEDLQEICLSLQDMGWDLFGEIIVSLIGGPMQKFQMTVFTDGKPVLSTYQSILSDKPIKASLKRFEATFTLM